MDFEKYFKTSARLVDEELEKILAQFLTEVKKTNTKLIPFAKGLINSCQGGKKIRGVLVKLGFEIAAGPSDPRNDVVRIGAAFEILHAGFLIHDDIQDQSLIRRDKKSLYNALGNNHYGISQAITLGDISLYLPIKIITESDFPGSVKIKALSHFTQMVINTGWGQVMDVKLTQKVGKLSKKDVEFINLNKTAKYTIAGPLQIGAILAGASNKMVAELGIFGENAGVAFQIQDDILDNEVVSVKKSRLKALEYALVAKKSIPGLTKQSLPLQGKDLKMSKLLEQMVDFLIERQK